MQLLSTVVLPELTDDLEYQETVRHQDACNPHITECCILLQSTDYELLLQEVSTGTGLIFAGDKRACGHQ